MTLRPLKESDFEDLYRVASDPLIWEQHPSKDRYKREVFMNLFEGALNSGGALAVLDSQSGNIIGSSRYYELNEREREIVIGFTFLARSYWGGICNQELKQLMLQHAFRYVRAVFFHVDKGNVRSQKALEKIGATKAGTFTKTAPDGRSRDVLIYKIATESSKLD